MYIARIDGGGGSYFDTREEAECELRLFGFRESNLLNADFEKYLFTGNGCKHMTATIEEVVE